MLTTTHTCILLLDFVSVVFIFMLVLVLVQAKFCKFFSFGEWRIEKNAHTHTCTTTTNSYSNKSQRERMEEDRAKGTKMENNQNFISSDNSGKNGSNGS